MAVSAAPLPDDRVESALPRITLRNAFSHPYDSAIAAARTCYAPRLIQPQEVTEKQRVNIGAATFYSGHHTVYQHAHFEFGLENVSRHFVWSFLHTHPFYNSEQQSQRYVRLDRAQAYVPPEDEKFRAPERAMYERAIANAWHYYRELARILQPEANRILSDIWHIGPMSHPRRIEKIKAAAAKRAIEVARYVLPVAAFTTMVHTLSGIVLHRLWRMQAACDTPAEARAVVNEMVRCAHEVDPQFFERFQTEPMEELPEWRPASSDRSAEAFAAEFDEQLGRRTSRLVDYSAKAPSVIANAYRAVMGLTQRDCSDAEAIDAVLNDGGEMTVESVLRRGLRKLARV